MRFACSVRQALIRKELVADPQSKGRQPRAGPFHGLDNAAKPDLRQFGSRMLRTWRTLSRNVFED
jgi:hypothetical protein